jgi:hypothetical protein
MDTINERFWCATCARLQPCAEDRPAQFSTASGDFDVFAAYHGVQWLWRTRACAVCGTTFITVEVPECVLHKGIKWRDTFLKAVDEGENKQNIPLNGLLKLASRAEAIGQIEDLATQLDAIVKLVKALRRLHRRSLIWALATEI